MVTLIHFARNIQIFGRRNNFIHISWNNFIRDDGKLLTYLALFAITIQTS